jgi:hypothetical protein
MSKQVIRNILSNATSCGKMNSPESAVCALWLNRLHVKTLEEQEAEEAFQSLLTIIGNVEVSLSEVERVAST